jgi:hypothetical protein
MKTVIPHWLPTTGYLNFCDFNDLDDLNGFNRS